MGIASTACRCNRAAETGATIVANLGAELTHIGTAIAVDETTGSVDCRGVAPAITGGHTTMTIARIFTDAREGSAGE